MIECWRTYHYSRPCAAFDKSVIDDNIESAVSGAIIASTTKAMTAINRYVMKPVCITFPVVSPPFFVMCYYSKL